MSEHAVLLIENPTKLSIDHGRLCLAQRDKEPVFLLPEDIAVVVLHHPAIVLTGHVLQSLAAAGVSLLITDAMHLPSGQLWPWTGKNVAGRRLRQQIRLEAQPIRGALWAQIVRAKIGSQAAVLRELKMNGALYLERLVLKVTDHDRHNHEAQAARHYWKHLLPEGRRRMGRGADDPWNSRLNFGYAVLRSLVARELAAAGLNPILGLAHCQKENTFNLADDVMEPYRHMVEKEVAQSDMTQPFDGGARVRLLSFITGTVPLNGRIFRLPAAVSETVASYCRVLEQGRGALNLPNYNGSQQLASHVGSGDL